MIFSSKLDFFVNVLINITNKYNKLNFVPFFNTFSNFYIFEQRVTRLKGLNNRNG